jgi:3-hydroxyisobutyrate dehydrogenase-like beta-hydroxyacid dehydrogenase
MPEEAKRGHMSRELNTSTAPLPAAPVLLEHPNAHILVSGSESVFQKAKPVLRLLAENLDYKGESIGLASAWEMVFIMHYYGMFMSLFHTVQICQAEGIPLEEYISVLDQQGKRYEKWLCENIQSGNYQETSAPLELWAGGIQNITQHALESNIHAEFPQLTARLFQQACRRVMVAKKCLPYSKCCRRNLERRS